MNFRRFSIRNPSSGPSSASSSSSSPDGTQPLLYGETYGNRRANNVFSGLSDDRVLIRAAETQITTLFSGHQVMSTTTDLGLYRMVGASPNSSSSGALEDDDNDLLEESDAQKSSFWRRWSRNGGSSRKGSVDSVESSGSEKRGWLASLKPLFGFKNDEQEISEHQINYGVSVTNQSLEDIDRDSIESVSDENRRVIEDASSQVDSYQARIRCPRIAIPQHG
ncbi:hypothetical protein ACMFMG_009786 [Clarireedia jacksonii]